jgi:hypothetical protein
MPRLLIDPARPAVERREGVAREPQRPVKVVLINPPFGGANGPYPAICYLAGFLETIGIDAVLADLSLEALLRVMSPEGLAEVRDEIDARIGAGQVIPSPAVSAFLKRFPHYTRTIETAVRALQGTDHAASLRAATAGYLPPPARVEEWARLTAVNLQAGDSLVGGLTGAQRSFVASGSRPLAFAFGTLGQSDEARFRATRMLVDVAAAIRDGLEPAFTLFSYAEQIARDLPDFGPLRARLEGPPTLLDRYTDAVTTQLLEQHAPDVVGLSVPFGGTLLGAMRVARRVRELSPAVKVILGGGWVNTNLRDLADPGIFDYVDYITLDDGERPLQYIIEMLQGRRSLEALARTFVRADGRVALVGADRSCEISDRELGTPRYRELPVRSYLALQDSLDRWGSIAARRWNKLTLAKGCYWKKCTFCDTRLPYIGQYEPSSVDILIGRIRELQRETGESGFHFVDEAMPPALLRRLAERLIAEDLAITWWGNVRFDSALVPLAPLLAQSGCCALTGGLEVASDRLLRMINKGITVEQVVRVTNALSKAGMAVNAYLMYGFPTQTVQETVDALEYVRQMFEAGCLHSAAWHRFTLTAYSPVAADPDRFGVQITTAEKNPFANYVLSYDEPGGIDHGRFSRGLNWALRSYLEGVGIHRPVHEWFDPGVPPASVPEDFVSRIISSEPFET